MTLAQTDPEETLKKWQSVIGDYSFHPDGKVFSEKEQKIINYLENSIENASKKGQCSEELKSWYFKHMHQNPDRTLQWWKEYTLDFSFDPDKAPQEQQNPVKPLENLPEQSTMPIEETMEKVDDSLNRSAQEMLAQVKIFMDREEFTKLEADLASSKPEAIIEKCNDLFSSHEDALKMQADVSKFIELSDKVYQTSVLNSGEARQIFPVLEQICEQYKNDERFEHRVRESGNKRAAQRVEQYHIEQKRPQSKSQGYEFEI